MIEKRVGNITNIILSHAFDVSLSRRQLIIEQEGDPETISFCNYELPKEELEKVPTGYFVKNNVLMRKWRQPLVPALEDWAVVYQVVIPKTYKPEIVRTTHEILFEGYLGINKICDKILRHFY